MRLIDGDALKEAFYQKMEELLKSTDTPQISNEALSLLCGATLITKAPTIESPVEKTGEWIATEYSAYDDTYRCSVCGIEWTFIEGTPQDNGANYCPNCGALLVNQDE